MKGCEKYFTYTSSNTLASFIIYNTEESIFHQWKVVDMKINFQVMYTTLVEVITHSSVNQEGSQILPDLQTKFYKSDSRIIFYIL